MLSPVYERGHAAGAFSQGSLVAAVKAQMIPTPEAERLESRSLNRAASEFD